MQNIGFDQAAGLSPLAVVGGAETLLGRAIAVRLVDEGYHVVGIGDNFDLAEILYEDSDARINLVYSIDEETALYDYDVMANLEDCPDILINVLVPQGALVGAPLMEVNEFAFAHAIERVLVRSMSYMQSALKRMVERGRGTIINVLPHEKDQIAGGAVVIATMQGVMALSGHATATYADAGIKTMAVIADQIDETPGGWGAASVGQLAKDEEGQAAFVVRLATGRLQGLDGPVARFQSSGQQVVSS